MVTFRSGRLLTGNTVYVNPESVLYIEVVNQPTPDGKQSKRARVFFSEKHFIEVEGNPDKIARYLQEGTWT